AEKPLASPSAALQSIPPSKSVGIFGDGEVFTISAEPQSGTRDLAVSPEGKIVSGIYSRVPSGYVIEKRGSKSKQVVLTFDDGPDEANTEPLLDALKELQVP